MSTAPVNHEYSQKFWQRELPLTIALVVATVALIVISYYTRNVCVPASIVTGGFGILGGIASFVYVPDCLKRLYDLTGYSA